MAVQRIVTFTTDFGNTDYYVGAIKGVILGINPGCLMVDISNSVQSFDLLDAALTIFQASRCFPVETIHMVIVDPGVGSARRPIVAEVDKQFYVAPDNGVLSLVYESAERIQVRHITAEHYFRQPVSSTFHGRDIFAPITAWLSKGLDPAKFGDEITDFVRFASPRPKPVDGRTIKGIVLKTDKFGNLITNFRPEDVPQLFAQPTPPFRLTVNKCEVSELYQNYSQGVAGKVFGLLGSMGYLEISANRSAASQIAAAGKGAEVTLTYL